MHTNPERIFISYSRADGRVFAECFEKRLEKEGITAWRDLKSMGSGDIRPQVLRAIERIEHFVLVLSQRAVVSDWIKREWTHARMNGRKVSPVLADRSLIRTDLPLWMRRKEIFDINERERWEQLTSILKGPGQERRVPYMPGHQVESFVPRVDEYKRLKEAVLGDLAGRTVGVTTALRGSGGYGKSVLANHLCSDDDVKFEFSDGILRIEIGKERDSVIELINDLIEKIDPLGKRPGFKDTQTAADHLAELIGDARLLLVIDDVWREAQLRPFLRGGRNCVRLITTRKPEVLPRGSLEIFIDEMLSSESLALLSSGLVLTEAGHTRRLVGLADRLGHWALMLAISNGWMHERTSVGEPLDAVITKFELRLNQHGLVAFDRKDESQRDRAIKACIEASLEDLDPQELARFHEFAILPEDENIPLGVVRALWRETGQLDSVAADELIQRLYRLSLLQNLDRAAETLRIHDNMIWYLQDRSTPDHSRLAHASMVRALGLGCNWKWETLERKEHYTWRFIIPHLRNACMNEEADHLLTSFKWIEKKLSVSGAQSLVESYLGEGGHERVQIIGRAIALSAATLGADPTELPRQIYGRLAKVNDIVVASLVSSARLDQNFFPTPRWPNLTPPGAEIFRLAGHLSGVRSATFSPNEKLIVTASQDNTARIWEAKTGRELLVLSGHSNVVMSACFSPDGETILTSSADGTARLWDVNAGRELCKLVEGERPVWSAVFSPDGTRIVTASLDNKAQIWEVATRQEVGRLYHQHRITSIAFSPDGASIGTASEYEISRLWDAATATMSSELRGHEKAVNSISFSADGRQVVTTSDKEVRIWSSETGLQIRNCQYFDTNINSACFSPDDRSILVGCGDTTVRVMDKENFHDNLCLRGHAHGVSSARFSSDGLRILSASGDGTARIWDAEVTPAVLSQKGHNGRVTSAFFSRDETQVLSASQDKTVRLWSTKNGEEIALFRAAEACNGAALSPDGRYMVFASWDHTVHLWDAQKGIQIGIISGATDAVMSALFSDDSQLIITASWDKTAQVFNIAAKKGTVSFIGHGEAVNSACFSVNADRALTASMDRTARLWDAHTGKELVVLSGHESAVLHASFSPDETCAVTASYDTTARIWNLASGHQTLILHGHTAAVNKASFSQSGRCVITASTDGTSRFWDASSGKEIGRITLEGEIHALDVSASAIVLGDQLGRVHILDARNYLSHGSLGHE